MKLFKILKLYLWISVLPRATRVERDSINSVSLSNAPEEKFTKMMVSANVGLNHSGNTLLSRDTTMMPNIPDLPSLVCMLFTPAIELRYGQKKETYVIINIYKALLQGKPSGELKRKDNYGEQKIFEKRTNNWNIDNSEWILSLWVAFFPCIVFFSPYTQKAIMESKLWVTLIVIFPCCVIVDTLWNSKFILLVSSLTPLTELAQLASTIINSLRNIFTVRAGVAVISSLFFYDELHDISC